MLSFQNNYQEGAHEKILARLIETNLEPLSGYGSDPYCESAKKKDSDCMRLPGSRCLVSDRRHPDQPDHH